jgi:DNA (cytosine-5)-methyltransferase 1
VTVRKALDGLALTEADEAPARLRETWQMWRVLNRQERQKHFGLVVADWDEPSPTVVKDPGNTTTGMIHPNRQRRFAIAELKRLASYPDGYRMTGSYRDQWSRIGNSVPPLFMRAIAGHIHEHILTAALAARTEAA